MVYRTLELTLISAKDLKHVTFISKMEVYAISSIDGDPRSHQLTPADRSGGTNPSWNTTLRFSIPNGDPSRHHLNILLRCHRPLGDKSVGEVRIPLHELLNGFNGNQQFISYQVRKISSNKVRGRINLSYRFLDAADAKAGEPVMAYPGGASSASYPPPPPPVGAVPYPPGSGYAYPPPQAGYGYPPTGYGYGMGQPTAARPARNNRFGMGTGLLGGALGGLLIGDMLSDHGGGYGGGYDGGYDDGGGYDSGGYDGGGFDGGGFDDGGGF